MTHNDRDQTTAVNTTAAGYEDIDQAHRATLGTRAFLNTPLGVTRYTDPAATTDVIREPTGQLAALRRTSGTHYPITDALGSIIALTDAAGTKTDTPSPTTPTAPTPGAPGAPRTPTGTPGSTATPRACTRSGSGTTPPSWAGGPNPTPCAAPSTPSARPKPPPTSTPATTPATTPTLVLGRQPSSESWQPGPLVSLPESLQLDLLPRPEFVPRDENLRSHARHSDVSNYSSGLPGFCLGSAIGDKA
jgi:hypothetical protein